VKSQRRIGLAAGLATLTLVGIVLFSQHSPSRDALQQYKAELHAQGEKLTFAELVSSHPASANRGSAAFTNAAARLVGTRLHPSDLQIRAYTGPGQARVAWREDSSSWSVARRPEEGDIWSEFAAEIGRLQKPLAELREALQDPSAGSGPPQGFSAGFGGGFTAIRNAAQWLAAVALCETRQGHLEEAVSNLEALAGLARMNRDEYTVVAQMIRVAVAGLGNAACWEVLQAPGWTEPQLERLQRAFASIDLLDGLEKSFLGERAAGFEIWALMRKSHGNRPRQNSPLPTKPSFATFLGDHVGFPLYKLTCMDEDEVFRLRAMQETLTAIRQLKQHQAWTEAKRDLDKSVARVNQAASSPRLFRYWFSMATIPNCSKAVNVAVRNETERRLTIVAIALERFHIRNGHFPPNLNALVPGFLHELPPDPMNGKPLRYELRPDGTPLLYSVGEDGQDNGGDASPASGTTFGLWDAPDAVWPSPAVARPR
jgi:hypothetical protein